MCVRTSIAFYGGFILDMDRSPGFGPAPSDSGPLQTRFPSGSGLYVLFRLGFPPAPDFTSLTSPDGAARRTVLQKVRGSSRMDVPQLADTGFQVLFHSPPGVLFTFPSQYYTLSVTE